MSQIDVSKLKSFNKLTAKSYNDQKALIKKVLMGRVMNCQGCKQVIKFHEKQANNPAKIACTKGCTDIELDIDL
ncbi:hypothetical protein [Thalassotalea maritima]|uniref:hypothetical protein n=1 Tax=Thalassotalea maritima TaxID=3242416 RepID=UPI0035282F47